MAEIAPQVPTSIETMRPERNIDEAMTVSELARHLRHHIEDRFGTLTIRGEVGRVTSPASGHIYFDLKDDKATLAAIIWRDRAATLKIPPQAGLEIICRGKLTIYPPQSRYQFIVESVTAAGAGALAALLEKRRRQLAAEGLFDSERKRALPFLPRCVGVITSPSGAVIADILHRLEMRFPLPVLLWPVRVQGEHCAAEVTSALNGFNALPPQGHLCSDGVWRRPDVLIIARGGGSLEDLWGFNDENLVRAIVASEIAVISAIGHETDITLADFAADQRAPTPTAAAEIITPLRSRLIERVTMAGLLLRKRLDAAFDQARTQLAGLNRSLLHFRDPLAIATQKLDHLGLRLDRAGRRRLDEYRTRFEILTLHLHRVTPQRRLNHAVEASNRAIQQLDNTIMRLLNDKSSGLQQTIRVFTMIDYRRTLRRGFAMVSGDDGKIVTAAKQLQIGTAIAIEFSDGRVKAHVGTISPRPKRSPKTPANQQQKLL